MFENERGRKDMRGFDNQFGVDPTSDLAGHVESRITYKHVVSVALTVSLALTSCGGGGSDKESNRQLIINRNNQLSDPTHEPGPGILGGMQTAQAVRTAQEADRLGITTATGIPGNGGWVTTPEPNE